MRVFLAILIAGIGFSSYGQENVIHAISIEWEQLSAPLSIAENEYKTNKYQLLEVDLTVDLRQQAFRKSYTMYIDPPKYKDISSKYTITSPRQKTSGFTITGSRNTSNVNNILGGGLKNTAYKDANPYNGAYYFSRTRRYRQTNNNTFIFY